MGKLSALLALFVAVTLSTGSLGYDNSHTLWKQVLNTYRTPEGLVAYGPLKKMFREDPANPLARYLKQLSEVSFQSFSSWPQEEQMAFLINAYNAFTVKWIVDHYPVGSIKKTVGWFSSPWKQEFFSLLDGKIKHLDAIEHEWLREKYQDARIHAAVNCASLSCPVLQGVPFTGKDLNTQLESAFRAFLGDPSRNRYEVETGVLQLSKLFDWFESDFEKQFGSLKKTVERFGPDSARTAIAKKGTVRFLDYDWGLNDSPSAPDSIARKKP
ncbi:MAG: DUF547 domain-containing protein [Bdellovibrionota bacterium]